MDIKNCTVCPRECHADRTKTAGFCGGGDKPRLTGTYKSKKGSIHGYDQHIDLKLHGLSAVFLKKTAAKPAKKARPVKEDKKTVQAKKPTNKKKK